VLSSVVGCHFLCQLSRRHYCIGGFGFLSCFLPHLFLAPSRCHLNIEQRIYCSPAIFFVTIGNEKWEKINTNCTYVSETLIIIVKHVPEMVKYQMTLYQFNVLRLQSYNNTDTQIQLQEYRLVHLLIWCQLQWNPHKENMVMTRYCSLIMCTLTPLR